MPTMTGISERPTDMLILRLRIFTGWVSVAQIPSATRGQRARRSPPADLTLARSET